jgi:tetratricopeptide (TPR) repeat protein
MRACPGIQCLIALFAVCCAAQPANPGELEDLLKNGAALNQQADYVHAIPLLRRATELAPQNPSANFLLGVALLESGHPADAVAPLRIAANANPLNEPAEGYLGDAEMEQNEFALAAETFQTAVARSPDSERALLWWTDYSLERFRVLAFSLRGSSRGRAAALKGTAENGKTGATAKEALLRQAAALDPQLNGVWGELGVAQAQLGMDANATDSLKTAQQRQPEASSTLQLEAMLEAARGNWSQAEKRLLDLGERSPAGLQKFLAAWPQRLVPGQGVKGAVWECLRQGTTSCPSKNVQGNTLPVEHLFPEGRWEQLAAMPAPPPDNATEWFWRGVAFAELGDCSQAIPALERGLKAGAETAASWLTSCYESEAVHAADQLKAQGKEASVHQIRGDILLSIRLDASQAAAEYTEALRLKPKNPEVLEKLAEAYFSLGDMDRARRSAQEALEQNPHRQQVLRLLVRVAMSERDYPTALSLLDRLAELEPDDAWTRVQQGTAYAQTGRPEEAVQRLKPALDAGYPDEKGALHAVLAGQLRKLGRDRDANSATDEAIKLADSFEQRTQNKPDEHQ